MKRKRIRHTVLRACCPKDENAKLLLVAFSFGQTRPCGNDHDRSKRFSDDSVVVLETFIRLRKLNCFLRLLHIPLRLLHGRLNRLTISINTRRFPWTVFREPSPFLSAFARLRSYSDTFWCTPTIPYKLVRKSSAILK